MSKSAKEAAIHNDEIGRTIRVGTTFTLEGAVLEVVKIGNRWKKVWVRPVIGFHDPHKMKVEEVFKAMDADDSPAPTPIGPDDLKVGMTFYDWGGNACEIVKIGKGGKNVWVHRAWKKIDPVKMKVRDVLAMMKLGAPDGSLSPFQVGVRECGLSAEREATREGYEEREIASDRVTADRVFVSPRATLVYGIDWKHQLYVRNTWVEVEVLNPEDYGDRGTFVGHIGYVDSEVMTVGEWRILLKDITAMRLAA